MKLLTGLALFVGLVAMGDAASAQDAPPAPAVAPAAPPARRAPPPEPVLEAGPWDLKTELGTVHVSVIARGLDHPWALAFLPGGDMLVTERPGRLRLIRKGMLDPTPIAGLPDIMVGGLAGLMDIAPHPKFAQNHLIYLTYSKPGAPVRDQSTVALMRAKWDGGPALSDVKDIFVADAWYGAPPLPKRCCGQGPASGSYGSRVVFDRKGFVYFSSGDRNYGEKVQDPSNDFGKIMRLKDDGSIPSDNPFVGKAGYKPEIWTIGHRNPEGLTLHPITGALWETEFGPRGGDELNLIEKGKNYGWIDVTQGFHYNAEPAKGIKDVPGMQDPVLAWGPPSINPGNLAFVTGDKFPAWKGNLLVGTMSRSLWRGTFDATGKPATQERMLTELKQRFRDVRMGPDGLIYLLTDEPDGAVLRVEPGK